MSRFMMLFCLTLLLYFLIFFLFVFCFLFIAKIEVGFMDILVIEHLLEDIFKFHIFIFKESIS